MTPKNMGMYSAREVRALVVSHAPGRTLWALHSESPPKNNSDYGTGACSARCRVCLCLRGGRGGGGCGWCERELKESRDLSVRSGL